MENSKHILVAPMDWGIGHASRCIPIIEHLLKSGQKVTIATSGGALSLLKGHFRSSDFVEIPSYDIRYRTSNAAFDIALQTPSILSTIKAEQKWLTESGFVDSLDGIISDNRYGLYSDRIPTTLITHQLNPRFPTLFKGLALGTLQNHLARFKKLWVPDFSGESSLSGDLSDSSALSSTIEFLGPLSRFQKMKPATEMRYRWLGIVSGPENQRTKFEKKLVQAFKDVERECLILAGQPHLDRDEFLGNTRILSHVPDHQFSEIVASSENIIARAGYSTIMDLYAMNKSALLIPTPKQSEQEYLAARCQNRSWFMSQSQQKLNLVDVDLSRFQPPSTAASQMVSIVDSWLADL